MKDMEYKSWLSNTISQPLQMTVDINYVLDCRGENYSIFTSEKLEVITVPIVASVKEVFLKPQFIAGNFSIHSPPKLSHNFSPLYLHPLLETDYLYEVAVT